MPEQPVKPAGFDSPIPKSQKILPDHIDPETRMAKGIAPDTKEMLAVNLGVLQAKHGKEEGLSRYTRIAKAGGFFDPSTEPVGSSYYPDLQLKGMDKDKLAAVEAILNEKE